MIKIKTYERQFIKIKNALIIASNKGFCPFVVAKCKKYRNCTECIKNEFERETNNG